MANGWPATAAMSVVLPGGQRATLRPARDEDDAFAIETSDALPSERGTALLGRCVREGERFVRSLTVGDREALLLHLRRLTIGEAAECVMRCAATSCAQPMEFTIAFGDLLLAPYEQPQQRYDLVVRDAGARYAVTFRLPTADDLDGAARAARLDVEEGVLSMLRACVLRAERDGDVVGADALPAAVRSAISSAMAERDPQAEIEIDARCPSCGSAFSALFDAAAFFLRELEERASELLHQVHTLALHYHWSESDVLAMPVRRRARYLELLAGGRPRAANG